jgi:hypothetical protein
LERWKSGGALQQRRHTVQWLEPKTLAQSNLSLDEQKDLVVFMEALTGQLAPEATTPPKLPK